MYTIEFSFQEKHKKPIIITNIPDGKSLLDVAMDNSIELHHNCGGVCACSTCHVYINSGKDYMEEISDKEENFIDRARNPKLNSRLACQCLLLKGFHQTISVTIPDQSIIQGE